VLLTGESGTGKEVIAHLIHDTSRRAGGPFVALNCAALPEALLEAELFGYEKGAFTGAVVARLGRVEQAAGGTLFLDEVGEMTPAVQAKFLRVLQEREFQRLGGTRVQKANVRVIAATNRDLHAALGRGELREDLYYRLHVFAICLPPLRERPEDIPALVEHFITALGPAVLGRPAAGISREAHERLLAHSWPGNVRELRNAVERALILSDGEMITLEHLPAPPETSPEAEAAPRESLDLETTERELVERALRHAGQNKAKAARLLGLTRTKLYTRMQRFGLS
jgi:transcriptional regulator with PAS, ATPase and Fis domain